MGQIITPVYIHKNPAVCSLARIHSHLIQIQTFLKYNYISTLYLESHPLVCWLSSCTDGPVSYLICLVTKNDVATTELRTKCPFHILVWVGVALCYFYRWEVNILLAYASEKVKHRFVTGRLEYSPESIPKTVIEKHGNKNSLNGAIFHSVWT